MKIDYRNTTQKILPLHKPETSKGHYDIYPAHDIGKGKIYASTEKLFWEFTAEKVILIDGYAGTFFHEIIEQLSVLYANSDRAVPEFIDISTTLKEEAEIALMLKGSMGGSDPLFGKRTKLSLIDFFDPLKLESLKQSIKGKNVVVDGTGASLISEKGFLVYMDLPKNEIQFRSRAGHATNIGTVYVSPSLDYKRNYFIDWIVQNRHKKKILLCSSGLMLEFSFDLLMIQEGKNILGDAHQRFGEEFPIRFDFLDTFDGGNLSIQCHPSPEYTLQEFGESSTQEETYYILDTKDDAVVYLGFQDDIDPEAFRLALEDSFKNSRTLEIGNYVQVHPSKKHDLFLIPYGTIHGSGQNNLVLEISSTPYIFTFKMYDWLRKDLNGQPRTINIDRGMKSLHFDRKGTKVQEELISKPVVIDRGEDWVLEHLPTHRTHLYDVHRYTFSSKICVETAGKCHVLSLVEGSSIIIQTESGYSKSFNYAETFILPAASGTYTIVNESGSEAKLVKAFVK